MTTQAQIQALHATLCAIAPESRCVLNMARERDWYDWLKFRPDQPFTAADLATVVTYRRALIARNCQFPASLKFSYLIGRPDCFEEDLSMARALPSKPTDRDKVLEATGRPARAQKPPRMAAGLAAAALGKLREAAK